MGQFIAGIIVALLVQAGLIFFTGYSLDDIVPEKDGPVMTEEMKQDARQAGENIQDAAEEAAENTEEAIDNATDGDDDTQ